MFPALKKRNNDPGGRAAGPQFTRSYAENDRCYRHIAKFSGKPAKRRNRRAGRACETHHKKAATAGRAWFVILRKARRPKDLPRVTRHIRRSIRENTPWKTLVRSPPLRRGGLGRGDLLASRRLRVLTPPTTLRRKHPPRRHRQRARQYGNTPAPIK